MKRHHTLAVFGLLLIVLGLALFAPAMAQEATGAAVPPRPEVLTHFYDAWVNSGHADVTARAFNRWNEEEDKMVPESCGQCHSTSGYRDFIGDDGSAAGVVDAKYPVGETITCDACHSETAWQLTEVTFPSGVQVNNLNDAARCMVCHQGRSSMNTVNDAVTNSGLTDMNAVSPDLRFINIHYYAAAATLYGSEAHGGYEYEGNVYQLRFEHVEGYDTCIGCHSPHTLEVNIEACESCHEIDGIEEVQNIRMNGSLIDYDGDGDMEEGIFFEVQGLQDMLYAAIQAYATDVAGVPILYDAGAYPYFFGDANASGTVDEGEGSYAAWTPNLLRAAYNFQVSHKDPGAFAHNAKYIIELLFDSTVALSENMPNPVDLSAANRDDPGHFNTADVPFRRWDEDGEVSASCTKCHTAEGLPFFLENGVSIAREPSNSLRCSTCHDNIGEFTTYLVNEVTFPSGATVSFGEEEPANLCISCHQGRESTTSMNRAIGSAGVGDDEVSESLAFRNVHYFAAGATIFGGDAMGGYQYEGQEYNGRFEHTRRLNTCVDCHDTHQLGNRVDLCIDCHEEVETQEDVVLIRLEDDDVEAVDYDGDGSTTEPVRDEIMALEDALYVVIQDYALNTAGAAIVYDSYAYPYFFIDVNGDGVHDADEERYATWTPRLLRAAYNYQYVQKDPGAFAHNADYILQLLFDSLADIGGPEAVATFTRPPLRTAE